MLLHAPKSTKSTKYTFLSGPTWTFAKNALKNWKVYAAADSWTTPLIKSLIWLKEEEWEVIFNDEDNLDSLKSEDIEFMLDSLCRD